MPWKALQRLFEMQGIKLSFDDSQKLQRLIKVKGDNDMVHYKEALSFLQPNFDLDDPIRSAWILRKPGQQANDQVSRFGCASSRMSAASASPSKLSMH